MTRGEDRDADAAQERVTSHFAARADCWDDIYDRHDVLSVVHQYRHEKAIGWVDGLRLAAGSRVLDLGCGAGHASVDLARRGFEVEAGDVAPEMLERTMRRARSSGVGEHVHARTIDAHALEYAANSFSLVLALGVVPWLHSPDRALAETARVLHPGGYLIASSGNRVRLTWLLDPMRNPLLEPTRRRGRRVLERLGLSGRPRGEPQTRQFSPRAFARMVELAGLRSEQMVTFGFGPFTLFNRSIVPGAVGMAVHARLQRLAERGVPLVRSVGEQCLVLARAPLAGSAPEGGPPSLRGGASAP